MRGARDRSTSAEVWSLVREQHGVIARGQLLRLGFTAKAIEHRLRAGRLHPLWPGVYAVGRPDVAREGCLMAAVLAAGPGAALSHLTAAAFLELVPAQYGPIEVSRVGTGRRRIPGIVMHRSTTIDVHEHHGIPVTDPALTLIDLAAGRSAHLLAAAVTAADKLDLIDPEQLRGALDQSPRRPGLAPLRLLLDRATFTLTDSELERRFLPIASAAGLPLPETGRRLNGFRTDFFWPTLALVVETDGLRYHRTPVAQARDRTRDQAHAAAGLTTLRFTHAQIRWERDHVRAILVGVARHRVAPGTPS